MKSFEGDCASSSESDYGKKKTELTGMYLISTDEEEVNKEDFVWDHAEMGIFVEEEKETVP